MGYIGLCVVFEYINNASVTRALTSQR